MSFQFKIQIKGITYPPIWRRVLVPEDIDFMLFHEILQAAFGWENDHMFCFLPTQKGGNILIGGTPYGDPGTDMLKPYGEVLCDYFIKEKQKWSYIYDFGDWWTHIITLEKITTEKITGADVLAGKGKCPREDSGGVQGYEWLVMQLENAKEKGIWPEDEYDRALPKDWDTDDFDLAGVREKVKNIRQRVRRPTK